MSDDTIQEELEQQETNEELDRFLDSLQDEIAKLRQRLKLLGRAGKPLRPTAREFYVQKAGEARVFAGNRIMSPLTRLLVRLRIVSEKKKTPRRIKLTPSFVQKIVKATAAVRQRMLDEEETDSLLKTHPPTDPNDKQEALDRLIAAVRQRVHDARAQKVDALAVIQDENVRSTIIDFYILYAIFIEYFNSMKVLYQVLLAEYEVNGALQPQEIGELRTSAISRIAVLLCQQQWLGRNSSKSRGLYRERMLKEIRRSLGKRAAAEENGKKLHPPLAALCLSGGGIRSATFGLGVIQALARHGLLGKFDYLSTVSGGGYIGSWLSAWVFREQRGITTVQNQLSQKARERVEAPEVTHLRSFSNYMSPRTGLFSADTWTLIGVYLRNLTLNWLVAVPLIAAFLLLPRLLLEFVYNGQALVGTGPTLRAGFVTIGSAFFGCLAIFAMTVFRPSLSNFLKPDSRFQQRFVRDDVGTLKNMDLAVIILCVVPMMLYAIGITSYGYWLGQSPERQKWVQVIQDALGANRWLVLGILFAIFAVLIAANLRYGAQSLWDKIVGSAIILLAILVGTLQLVFPQELMLFNMVLFTNIIFIVGFVAARGFIWWQQRQKSTRKDYWHSVPIEFSISFLAASVGGTLLYAVDSWLRGLQPTPEVYATVAVPLFVGVFMAAATLFIGIGSKILDDLDREWASRYGAWLLVAIVIWLAVCATVLVGPILLQRLHDAASDWLISIGGLAGVISGAITLIFGYYANNAPQEEKKPKGKKNKIIQIAPQIAAPVFAVFLLILIVLGTNRLMGFVGDEIEFMRYQFPPSTWPSAWGAMVILIWILIFVAVGCLMGWWINVNKFSLHAAYRDRLIRAFLGASRGTERLETANSFIDFDERDNVEMCELKRKPFHVVNMTLNTAGSSALRWQTRKSESFTVTPLHCGSSNMGGGTGNYRSSHLYGADKQGGPITLGTAAAISGAAASPNMGYYTQSAAVSALMALFNVRLGWWLGNPGRRGNHTFYKNAPEWAPKLFFYEALGRTADTNAYVYLSDGGHFENLGLYEMVLRRCRLIVLSDAGADEGFGFSDLGSAIHKIRVDMGIPIEFVDGELPVEGRSCSIAKILYSCVDPCREEDDGVLIYIKPTLDGCEPVDVVNYRNKHEAFPHESTADQWFGELQFESYRSLGSHMMNAVWGVEHTDTCPDDCPTLTGLLAHAEAHVKAFRANGSRGYRRDTRMT